MYVCISIDTSAVCVYACNNIRCTQGENNSPGVSLPHLKVSRLNFFTFDCSDTNVIRILRPSLILLFSASRDFSDLKRERHPLSPDQVYFGINCGR